MPTSQKTQAIRNNSKTLPQKEIIPIRASQPATCNKCGFYGKWLQTKKGWRIATQDGIIHQCDITATKPPTLGKTSTACQTENLAEIDKELILDGIKAPRFPVEVLPETFRRLVTEAAASFVCPPDFIAVPLLTEYGAAIGATKKIEAKRGWQEKPCLYSTVIAPPGSGKSAGLRLTTGFLARLEKDNQAYNEQIEKEYEQAMADYEEAMTKYRIAKKTDEQTEKPSKPERKGCRRLLCSDVTAEAVAEILSNNPQGIIVARDELMGWITGQNQYKGGKGSDKQFWLSAWDGGNCPVDRKGKKPLLVNDMAVSVTGAIPPREIGKLKANIGDGFTDRILFSYPDHMKQVWSEDEISQDTLNAVHELFTWVYADQTERVLKLTKKAKATWIAWYNKSVEDREQANELIREPLSKMPRQILRLALILTLAENPMATTIDQQAIASAIVLADYFAQHLRKTFGLLEAQEDQKQLRRLIEYAKRRGKSEVSTRDLAMNHLCPNAATAKALINLAAAQGIGYIEKNRLLFAKEVLV